VLTELARLEKRRGTVEKNERGGSNGQQRRARGEDPTDSRGERESWNREGGGGRAKESNQSKRGPAGAATRHRQRAYEIVKVPV
jgi:hypothetical protein